MPDDQILSEPAKRYAGHLSAMIRYATVSAGREPDLSAFTGIRSLLESLYPLVHANLEKTLIDERSLLYHWKGQDESNRLTPVVLLAHHDVVEATGAWTHPPFAGEISGGQIWGRGVLDNKGSLCAILEAIEHLLAEGFRPRRDIWLASSHEEESMGDGAAKIAQYLDDMSLRPLMVLDEGGAVMDQMLPGVAGQAAVIGVAEKGYLNIRITAHSAGGHASTPPAPSTIGRLAELICTVERHSPFPARFNRVTRNLFRALTPRMSGLLKFIFSNLWLFGPFMKYILPALGGEARAMVMTTCAFTMCQGSGAPNVLPETALVTANLRIGVHQTSAQVLAQLERLTRPRNLAIETLYAHEASPAAPESGPAYDLLLNSLKAVFPDAIPVPYIMLAASDSRHFTGLTPNIYRFSPFELSKELRRSIHGVDERLPAAALEKAVIFYQNLIRQI
ncbi:MAG: M20/M25/M40 family metallo-hydrolase [Clostridiaceae bacterium]|nr:M20/M25/M40 family metallo-hydrolase [Clostridiaceae bacterium]